MEAICIEGLSKKYRLGVHGSGLLYRDLQSWWARTLGRENPNSKVMKNRRSDRTGDEVWALRDIDLRVREGEVIGIIGRNGAGKSTVLKILSRVTAPTSGIVKTRGRLATLLEVGTGFHPELTGRENTYLNGAILGMTKREITAVLDEIVEFAGLGPYLDTPVKRYSSGMYVRLAFAVAAHLRSDIMIVDEVLAVGDIEFQRRCIGKMQGVSTDAGKTVLFVSHNMATIESLCPRSVLLNAGHLEFDGRTTEAIERYTSMLETVAAIEGADRTDRWGDGNALLLRTWVETVSTVGGKARDYKIFLEIDVSRVDVISYLHYIIEITTDKGTQISFIASEMVGFQTDPEEGILVVACTIRNLVLNEGVYYYKIVIRNSRSVEDVLLHAGRIEVPQHDYYGTGKLPPGPFPVIVDHEWEQV